MKILRIIARLNVGGPAKHVIWLTDRLRRRGYDSVLVAGTVADGEENMEYFAEMNGVRPVYLREMSRELSFKDAVSLWKLYVIMRRECPDIVHTHTAKAGTVGRMAALLYRWGTWRTLIGKPRQLRVVHTFHGHVLHGYYGRTKSRLFAWVERFLAWTATDKIIVISDQQLAELNGTFHIGRKDQFELVPLGIDLDIAAAADGGGLRDELEIENDTFLLAFVGRLTEIKDIPFLLHALAICTRDAEAPRMKLVVVGDGHLRSSLEDLSRILNIESDVAFVGNSDKVVELIGQVDVVALTSKNEGTPLSLIEAMASGAPVVAAAVGGVIDLLGRPERITHEGFQVCERGIAVASRSPDDFARALIYLAQNEKLRERLSEAGRQFVQENYSIDRLEKDIAQLYLRLMDEEASSAVEAHV